MAQDNKMGIVRLTSVLTGCFLLAGCNTKERSCTNLSDRDSSKFAMERVSDSIGRGGNRILRTSEIAELEIEKIDSEKSYLDSPYYSKDVHFFNKRTKDRFLLRIYEDCEIEWREL